MGGYTFRSKQMRSEIKCQFFALTMCDAIKSIRSSDSCMLSLSFTSEFRFLWTICRKENFHKQSRTQWFDVLDVCRIVSSLVRLWSTQPTKNPKVAIKRRRTDKIWPVCVGTWIDFEFWGMQRARSGKGRKREKIQKYPFYVYCLMMGWCEHFTSVQSLLIPKEKSLVL